MMRRKEEKGKVEEDEENKKGKTEKQKKRNETENYDFIKLLTFHCKNFADNCYWL